MENNDKIINGFKELISFRSTSGSKEQIKFRDFLQNKYGGEIIEGNLIITKGIPNIAIVAHLDINQPKGVPDVAIFENIIYSRNTIGCGFDDKAGIHFALSQLNRKDIQLIFTMDEEIGCIGAKKVKLNSHINFLIQLDRRGNSDVSSHTNGIQVIDKSLQKKLVPILNSFGYTFTKCLYTDIGEIAYNNSCQAINISCGYYFEHTKDEYLNINEYVNACSFAKDIIDYLTGKQVDPLIIEKPIIQNYWSKKTYQKYSEIDNFDSFYDFDNGNEYLYDILDNLTLREIDQLKIILKNY